MGIRSSKIHFGIPKLASLFSNIFMFTGSTTISKAIIDHKAYGINFGMKR